LRRPGDRAETATSTSFDATWRSGFRDRGILIALGALHAGLLPAPHCSNRERVVPMPKRRQSKEPEEPIGIVISGWPSVDLVPRLSAYVYSIEDETSGEPIEVKAA